MKKTFTLLLFSLLISIHWMFSQTTLVKWTFETSVPTTAGPHAAEEGTGQASGWHVNNATAYTNPAGNGSAESFSSDKWAIGDYYQIQFSTTGISEITLTWDATGSNTGPRDFKVQYSVDGSNFTDASGTNSTYQLTNDSWSSGSYKPASTRVLSLTTVASLNNTANVFIRFVCTSTTSIGGGTVAAAGTSRIDDIKITYISPPNNNCANAISLGDNVQSPLAGTTTNATLTAGAPNGSCTKPDTPTGDVWYLLEDADTGDNRTVTITVAPDASEDYGIYLYKGACAVLEYVACVDAGTSGNEILTYTFNPTFNGEEGSGSRAIEDLYVRVRQFGSNVGTFTISTLGNALPLTFENITAKATNKTALIEWTTTNEVNTAYMDVEHNNGASLAWKSVGKIAAAGYAAGKTEYSFTHETPLKGDNFYRIKQVDSDGTFRFSKVVYAHLGNTNTGLIITPNLVHNSLKISFEEPVENGRILIYNLDGKLVQSHLLAEGIDVLRVDVSGLASGQYVIQYQSDKGSETVRFVKE